MSEEATETVEPARQYPYTMKLGYPIEFGKESISELVFKRGTVGDIEGLKVDGVPTLNDSLLIASRLCGKPVAALKKLDPDDSSEVIAIALGFFAKCLGAGKTS